MFKKIRCYRVYTLSSSENSVLLFNLIIFMHALSYITIVPCHISNYRNDPFNVGHVASPDEIQYSVKYQCITIREVRFVEEAINKSL